MSYKKYTVRVFNNGDRHWLVNGHLHREDGPAVEDANGGKQWFINDRRHREDGPAIEHASGSKLWYINGKCHREDGPAVEEVNGTKLWYLRGKKYTEEEFLHKMNPASCEGKEIEIDGKTYILKKKS